MVGGSPAAREHLAGWGARCLPGDDPDTLKLAADFTGMTALCWLPPDHLPIRPPAGIASALLDGAEHVGDDAAAGWCLTAPAARIALALASENGGEPVSLHRAALRAAKGRLAPPPSHCGPAPLRLPDLPAAFASGRAFAGPFLPEDRMATTRALGATRRTAGGRALKLPPNLRPLGDPPAPRPGEILAVVIARNESLRLPDALAALRALGVDRPIVLDNCSEDGTREIAAAAGAHVVLAEEDYAASGFGVSWVNALLDACGMGHWVLVLDADEQLVFPGSEHTGLKGLTDHLDQIGSEAFRTIQLDCFPPGPLAQCRYQPGTSLARTASLFEPPKLRAEEIKEFPYTLEYGGIRERLFFPEANPRRPVRWARQKLYNLGLRVPALRASPRYARLAPPRSPTITKVPLLRWREGAALIASTHRVAPMAMTPGQPTGVLLHFKFLQDFHARALDAVARNAHWDESREYRRYLERMEADPAFSLDSARAQLFTGPEQLLTSGLMRDTAAWRKARGTA